MFFEPRVVFKFLDTYSLFRIKHKYFSEEFIENFEVLLGDGLIGFN